MGPIMSTTKVEEDVDGRPPGGHCQRVRQRPPPRLKTTSMVGPLGALLVGLAASTTEVGYDVDGGPLGALPVGPIASTTKVEDDINVGPLGGTAGASDSVHH
jgi:hypothetical protein